MQYLNARGIEIIDRNEPLKIVDNAEMLADVAGLWKSHKGTITAVIQARCDKLREKLIFSDQPFEIPVTRQALVELAGILEDFENIQAEFENRDKGKEEVEEKTE